VEVFARSVISATQFFFCKKGGQQEDAEEFFGFFMDSLEEELLSLSDSGQANKSVPAITEPGVTSGEGWVEVGKKNKQVLTRTVRFPQLRIPDSLTQILL